MPTLEIDDKEKKQINCLDDAIGVIEMLPRKSVRVAYNSDKNGVEIFDVAYTVRKFDKALSRKLPAASVSYIELDYDLPESDNPLDAINRAVQSLNEAISAHFDLLMRHGFVLGERRDQNTYILQKGKLYVRLELDRDNPFNIGLPLIISPKGICEDFLLALEAYRNIKAPFNVGMKIKYKE